MFFKISFLILAVALPAIHGFGLSSKLSALLGNQPVTTTYTLPAPSTITVSPVTSPTNTYTSPIIYTTPTYVPTPYPVPVPTGTTTSSNRSLADAMDQEADGGRRRNRRGRQRVQRVYPKRRRRMLKRRGG